MGRPDYAVPNRLHVAGRCRFAAGRGRIGGAIDRPSAGTPNPPPRRPPPQRILRHDHHPRPVRARARSRTRRRCRRPPLRARCAGPARGFARAAAVVVLPSPRRGGGARAFDRPAPGAQAPGGRARRCDASRGPAGWVACRGASQLVRRDRRCVAGDRDARRADSGMGPHPPLLRRLRDADVGLPRGARAALPGLQARRLSADLARDDGAGHRWRPSAARSGGQLSAGSLQRARRIPRGRGERRGRGAPRGARGGSTSRSATCAISAARAGRSRIR